MEEFDYMSDDFLNTCLDNDLRPGLVHSRANQRKIEIEKKKLLKSQYQKNTSSKTLATNQLNEGLETALGPENKGFRLLEKMGYKPGSSLGTTQKGIIEPISIQIKNNRKGLGREEALKDIIKKKIIFRENQKHNSIEDFRAGMSRKFREREIESDLLKSQKACHTFDTNCLIFNPEESWFWPKHLLPEEDSSDSEENDGAISDEFKASEKLEMLTIYLRKTYLYCLWCGVEYADERDFASTCPGLTRDEH